MSKKLLITDDVHDHLILGLKELGYEIIFKPKIPYEEVADFIPRIDGIIINSKVIITDELMGLSPKTDDGAHKLKFIGRLGSGLDIIDLKAAERRGIAVLSTPGGNRNAVAEHALGMLLALANQLHWADQDVRRMEWNRESRRGFELIDLTIGIIGFGNNGRAFAQKLQGMEMNVLAYDKYKSGYAADMPWVKECLTPEEIQKASDIISLHVPLDDNTYHLINEDYLLKCKDDVIIINTARGKCIDTKALLKSLENGRVKGACLDVFENEKPATFTESEFTMYEKLYHLNQVILSPHVAGWTHESKYKIADILLSKIAYLNN